MTHPDDDYDPDDNFANSSQDGMDVDVDDDAAAEALVWQLLLMINPGDEESALQQFGAWQELTVDGDPDEVDPLESLQHAIDWKSGFHVDASDRGGLVESLDELSARFDVRIAWDVEDLDDEATGDETFDAPDVPALIVRAHAQLREHGYTLWTWNPRGGASEDTYSGWIALRRDEEAMLELAHALGIEVRLGNAH